MNQTIFKWRSLQTRVTLVTLTIFVISILLLALYARTMLRKNMANMLGEHQLSTVSLITSDIDKALNERFKALDKIAATIHPADMGNPAQLQTALQTHPVFQALFNAGIIAYRPDGNAIADIPHSVGRTGVNYMDIDTVAAALKEGKSTVGRPVIGKKLHVPVFGMTVPIRDDKGHIIGALEGVTNLSQPSFLDTISQTRFGQTGGYSIVTQQQRLVVTSTDKKLIQNALPAPGLNSIIDHAIQGKTGFIVYANESGDEWLASTQRIPLANWIVVASLPMEEVFAPMRSLRQRMLLATLVFTLLGAALTWWILRRQLSPLLATVKTLATLSETVQHPQPLPIVRQDEIGQLIGGFNGLLKTLAQREADLQESDRLLRESQRIAGIGSYVLDISSGEWTSSEVCDKLFGIGENYHRTVEGWVALIHPDDRVMMADYFANEVLGQGRNFDKEYRIIRQNDGATRWVHGLGKLEFDVQYRPQKMPGTIQDITERKQMEDQVRQLAFHDPLTKLPNRLLLDDRLNQAMATSNRTGYFGALMFLDLDNFKSLNDTYGHVVGDLLLIEVAHRLKKCVRETDTVARFGGDEFVVMLSHLNADKTESSLQAMAIAEKIRAALLVPYRLTVKHDGKADAEIEHHCTASIGVVLYFNHEASQDDILKWADMAMYQAKDAGRNAIRFYDLQA
ncbi:MAG: diguanylate cyclase [Formivibrio sp.]|nr:diguanylate cyclase [Formivibrio sp.]